MQEKIFEKIFTRAEIAKLKPEEMEAYEESLKVYRDNKNTMDYAIATAKNDTRVEIAKALKKNGVSADLIGKSAGLTKEEIDKL